MPPEKKPAPVAPPKEYWVVFGDDDDSIVGPITKEEAVARILEDLHDNEDDSPFHAAFVARQHRYGNDRSTTGYVIKGKKVEVEVVSSPSVTIKE